MRAKTFLFVGLCVFLIVNGHAMAAPTEVVATVDKNPVMVDESFILTVTANDSVDNSAFDPSVLMKDFVLGRTSVSSQTKMINFKTSRTTSWNTTLIPRKQGRFTIPEFEVAGQRTEAIPLMVVPVSSASNNQARDIFITTDLDVSEVYLQQQLRYTVKLYLGQDLQRGSLSSPTLENADIRQIAKDKDYNEIKDGRRYRVIEKTFAIIPQQSGDFTIEGPILEGEIIDNSRQSFGFFNRSSAVSRVGPSQKIVVLPIPENYPTHWLPSDFVQINEEWQGEPAQYHVGEPITRTITLTAIGVVEEQLPTIDGRYPNNVKTYPDQAETATVEKDNTLIAQRKESVAIIPSEPGQLIIPEIRIPWFNVLTKKTEYTTLPQKSLTILPAINQPVQAIPPANSVPTSPADASQITNTATAIKAESNESTRFWQIVSLALLILWIITLVIWIWQVKNRRKNNQKVDTSNERAVQSENVHWSTLQKALHESSAKSVATLLPPFLAQTLGQNGLTLPQALQKINDQDLTEEVNRLLASQYGNGSKNWDGKQLEHALMPYVKNATSKRSNQPFALKPLYPSENNSL